MEIMKTKAQSLRVSTAIYTLLFILIAGAAFGSELKLNGNIEDLPPVKDFEEEEYVDDIPFDTKAIAEASVFAETINVTFDFEEEEYVDDIPFNTYQVVMNCKLEKYLEEEFDFEEEAYVDDIPFDTEEIFNEVFFKNYYANIEAKRTAGK